MASQGSGSESLPKALTFADLQSEAHAAVTRVIEGEFKGRSYDRSQAGKWVADANTGVTEALQGLSKVSSASAPICSRWHRVDRLQNFKYAVNTIVMQKKDAGLDVSTAAHWDVATVRKGMLVWNWKRG